VLGFWARPSKQPLRILYIAKHKRSIINPASYIRLSGEYVYAIYRNRQFAGVLLPWYGSSGNYALAIVRPRCWTIHLDLSAPHFILSAFNPWPFPKEAAGLRGLGQTPRGVQSSIVMLNGRSRFWISRMRRAMLGPAEGEAYG
jgi:hypothetical protein